MGFLEAAFFNFDSVLYYAQPVIVAFASLAFVMVWVKSKKYTAKKGNLLLYLCALLAFLSENIIFFVASVKQPAYDMGFWITEFSSVVLFYLSVFTFLIGQIVGIFKGFINAWTFKTFTRLSMLGITFQISICLAFGSPAMGCQAVFYFLNCIGRLFVASSSKLNAQFRKAKKD